ncbi:hypothetical protein O181_056428 [Austropuccinia psidii MF-1]|uniref:Uncharacterized protein n=1 Tax=Austropuccinia psidii MF-1 TaxID=1389203 RepID=A0A9Q3HTF4_9BASI|nr:hypothetical protein [Austropuccinia psidii MF-1]
MFKKEEVTTSLDPALLSIFNQRFTNTEEIESAISNDVPSLVPIDTIEKLQQLQSKGNNVGNNFINLSDFMIRYVQVSLSKLGTVRWAPKLLKQPNSKYREACRISAVKNFRQLDVGDSYVFMNVNTGYVNDLHLLIQSYDNYVHFYIAGIFHKELNEEWKNRKEKERDALQKFRERVQNVQYKFSVSNNLQKRYQRVLKQVKAHVDEEFNPKKNFYISRKLAFRSEAANIFMQKLDEKIKDKAELTSQRRNSANIENVAFLKDPTESLAFKDSDEKLGDKSFTNRNWDSATRKYNLNFLIEPESDSAESSKDEDMDYGESISLKKS